ncbi:MAG: CotH kinase family protein, partial [Chitinophagales bacterium]
EHNDPCITRSKLYWDILKSMRVPGPRANHIDLYINGNYFGLYVNVEEIDENFVKSRFANNNGNLYKCLYPADLNYISNNPDDYKFEFDGRRTYELETNTDADNYTDLANFISMLKFTYTADFPAELEKQFNVNSFLRAYAVDVATGNWDDYMYNQNNYYLYHNTETGKFEFIPYDTDNTFGIDWFGIDWGVRNIYSWYNTSLNIQLMTRIFAVPEYVNRFTFFTKQLQAGLFDTTNVFPKIDSILEQTKYSAQQDSFRTLDYGWDYNDFLNSFTEPLDFQVKYGLKPYFTTRHDETANELQNTNVIPIISNVNHLPKTVHENDSVFISAWIEDESLPASTLLYYKINNSTWNSANMTDDGMHEDGLANDGVYGALIMATNNFDTIHYYITATDVNAQTGREPRVDDDIIVVEPIPNLVINELMASNHAAVADEYGEFDDWLEIYNADSLPSILGNKYLSDEPGTPDKWRLPDVTLPAHSWALIWCDNETYQGDFHASFKLNAGGEQAMIYESTGLKFILLDSISWENLATDISIGCYPDGVKPIIQLTAPTPGYSNLNVGVASINQKNSVFIYPNPFTDHLSILLKLSDSNDIKIDLMNLLGENVFSMEKKFQAGSSVLQLNNSELENLSAGIYLLKISDSENKIEFSVKLVKN